MKALLLVATISCAAVPNSVTPAAYGAELEECNRTAKDCTESIACENVVRAKYKRPARDVKAGCQ